jgi:ParB family transcriptional regulator, chromosome partitioning protein
MNISMVTKVKKTELGKGIAALLGNIESEVNKDPEAVVRELSHTIASIKISDIEVNPWQPRYDFDQDALNELSESIKIHGLIQPITVRRMSSNQYQLISGERRLRASKIAGILDVPAYIRIANDQEMLEMALVENIQREELNPIEIAITYQRLIDECALTHEKLSDRVAKNRSTVTNSLRLLRLPPEIQTGIKEKRVTTGHAKVLVGIDDIALQLMLFKRIMLERLSVREVEDIARSYAEAKNKKKAKSDGTMPDAYKPVQDMLSSFFGSKVALKRKPSGQGQIMINFKNDGELNRILDLIEEKK